MSNGLAITRSIAENKNELLFCFKNQNGDDIRITQKLIKIKSGYARVAICAPDEVTILRGELVK